MSGEDRTSRQGLCRHFLSSDMLAHKRDKTTLLPQALRERIEEQGLNPFFNPLCVPTDL